MKLPRRLKLIAFSALATYTALATVVGWGIGRYLF
jgi:hypothetical protein